MLCDQYTLYPEHQMFANIFPVIHKETGMTLIGKSFDLKILKNRHQYENEAKLLEILSEGKKIINLHSRIDEGDRGLLIIDKLSGDLLDLLECPNFDQISAVDVFIQTCEAIEYAHDHQVAHLDIKPENVLYNREGPHTYDVVLADFGSSVLLQEDGIAFNFRGTLHYSAPEVYAGTSGYDAKSADIWSLGILFHVLLTGCWPYPADSEDELRDMVANGSVDISQDLQIKYQTILRGMLQRESHLRPTIGHVLESLRNDVASRGPSGNMRKALRRVTHWMSKRFRPVSRERDI